MRLPLTALLATLALYGCATAKPPARDGCDAEVRFGSYAMGVDQPLRGHILAFMEDNPHVAGFTETPWGREGESTLCIQARDAAATNRIYDDLVGLIPRLGERAPTTVTHRDGRSHASSMPPGT